MRTLWAVLACGIVLAACSRDGTEDSTASPSSVSASSESASSRSDGEPSDGDARGPRMPAVAQGSAIRAATAFTRYYIDLRNYAASTGDVRKLRSASQNCSGCDHYANLYKSTYEAGGFIKSSGWRVASVDVLKQSNSFVALVTVDAPKMRYSRTATDDTHIGRGGLYKLRFEIVNNGRKWVVTHFGVQADVDDV